MAFGPLELVELSGLCHWVTVFLGVPDGVVTIGSCVTLLYAAHMSDHIFAPGKYLK